MARNRSRMWHGRPAREITRKMRVPHQTAAVSRFFMAFVISLVVIVIAAMSQPRHAVRADVSESLPQVNSRPRAREAGIIVGVLPTGPLNAITDVPGVAVGHATLIQGDNVRTGVTAILPHNGNLFREKVPGAVFIGNAFGKLAGSTQVNELGEIETPIMLTSTLNVPRVADATLDYMLALPGNEEMQSINPWLARPTTDT
jgi:hypothetical protein